MPAHGKRSHKVFKKHEMPVRQGRDKADKHTKHRAAEIVFHGDRNRQTKRPGAMADYILCPKQLSSFSRKIRSCPPSPARAGPAHSFLREQVLPAPLLEQVLPTPRRRYSRSWPHPPLEQVLPGPCCSSRGSTRDSGWRIQEAAAGRLVATVRPSSECARMARRPNSRQR